MQTPPASFTVDRRTLVDGLMSFTGNRRLFNGIYVSVGGVAAVLGAVMLARSTLGDLPDLNLPNRINEVVMGSFYAGLTALAAFFYRFTAANLARSAGLSCQRRDFFYGVANLVLIVAVFIVFWTRQHGAVFYGYIPASALYLAMAWLAVTLLPALMTIYACIFGKNEFALWASLCLVLRLFFIAGLAVAIYALRGATIYRAAQGEAILDYLNFDTALNGFVAILIGLACAFVLLVLIGYLTFFALAGSAFFKNTVPVHPPQLLPVMAGAFVAAAVCMYYAGRVELSTLSGVSLGVLFFAAAGIGLLCHFFKLATLQRETLALFTAFAMMVVFALPFFVQHFGDGTARDRFVAFMFTPLVAVALVAYLLAMGFGRQRSVRRLLAIALAACSTAASGYAFMFVNDYDALLPDQISSSNLFNFILIGTALFTALAATFQTVLATTAAGEIAALRIRRAIGRQARG